MSEETKQQQYGGVTDEDCLKWLQRNYAPLPKADNTPLKQGEQGRQGAQHAKN